MFFAYFEISGEMSELHSEFTLYNCDSTIIKFNR
jgi:hypothetical protein